MKQPGITPVLLTLNEAPNIERTLASLQWAASVVVVDSGSTDETERIAGSFPNVRWFQRPFESHGRQWAWAIRDTGIDTPLVLALDADMIVPAEFVEEFRTQFAGRGYSGGIVPFRFVMQGSLLMGSIYPAQLRVFLKDSVEVTQRGHTQQFSIAGPVSIFRTRLLHDDRKSLERWTASQLKYTVLECARMREGERAGLKDGLRRAGLMPLVAGLLAYLRAGGPLRGSAARRYALERAAFECLLGIRMIQGQDAAAGCETRGETRGSVLTQTGMGR